MKHMFTALACSIAAACAAAHPTATYAEVEAALDETPAEKQEQSLQKVQRASSEGNTYEDTCGPLGERFRASDPTRIWEERIGRAVEANQASGAQLNGNGGLPHIAPPSPKYPSGVRKSGVCELILDVSADGFPSSIEATCTDPVFEQAAIEGMKSAQFKPALSNGQPAAYHAMHYPMEFCIND